ncbi:HD domain-containing protein [Pilimelia columellifera]
MSDAVAAARSVAEGLLAEALPRRWRHVQAVGHKAEEIGRILPAEDRGVLACAAWLHDVGYAPSLVDTGLHALDGARWLARSGHAPRVAALVAHHSCASFEAAERGLSEALAEFRNEQSPTTDALWFADMTTGPDGQTLNAADRLAEIRRRYGPDDVVTRFWAKAEPTLLAAIRRVEARLRQPM